MESVRNWTKQELPRGLLVIFLSEVYGISEEMDKELHRGLLLISLLKGALNQ